MSSFMNRVSNFLFGEAGRRGRRPRSRGTALLCVAGIGVLAAIVVGFRLVGQTPKPTPDLSAADRVPCETLRKHGDPGARACWERLSRSSIPAVRAEGLWGLKDYKGAFDTFNAAVDANPKNVNLKVRYGLFLLDAPRGKPSLGDDQFKAALQMDEKNAQALLGLAKVAEEDFGPDAVKLAEQALESDPKLYEARELIARVALEDNNEDKAVAEANKAVAMSPEALDAMAILATVDWLNDKPSAPPVGQILTTSPWIDKILKVNPHDGEAYATAGHFFVINRRYTEGIEYYRKALELDPDLQGARSELGINLMRLGKEEEAKSMLEQAWNAGYQDKATQNTLNLMTSYAKFDTFKTPTTILKIQKKESALVRPYLQAELDKIIATYEKKYKYHLTVPVQVEAYPDHEDFAVRTVGMPGLGALGVTFNTVVAIDSPSAADPQRGPGSFHWATTLWHEMSHVYVLSMTNSRVPRWFTEGLAVYEETAINPDWGARLDPPSIMAIRDKKLLPIADLDRGYIHPTYPEQVIVSYFQGGRTLTYIVQKWGYDTVLNMIRDYGNNLTTPQVIEKELKITPEEFDKQFIPWVEAQTKTTVENFGTWSKGVRTVNDEIKTKDWAAVIKDGTAIRDLYSDYVEPGSIYEALAQAYTAQKDTPQALAQLKRYAEIGGRNPDTLRQLATLEQESGDKRAAVATLEKINYIYLRDEKAHQMLADLDMELGNPTEAIQEYSAVLALKPVDPAGTHYRLAKAYQAVHKDNDAMDEVLSSLEIAPGYRDAQKLLLELNKESPIVKQ
jgi:cellulose synthase operon protein C